MIRRTLLQKEIREHRWIMILGLVFLFATALMGAMIFDWIAGFIPEIKSSASSAPEWARRLLGNVNLLKDFSYSIWSNWNPKNLIQFGGLTCILLGVSGFAGEREKGTISFLLSNGVTRRSIFITKLVFGLLASLVVFMLPTIFIPVFSKISGHVLEAPIITASLVTWFGGMVIYSLSVLMAVSIPDRVKAGLASAGIVIGFGIIGMFPGGARLALLRYSYAASYYFGVSGFPWLTVLLLAAVSGVLLWLAQRKFRAEDL